MADCRWIRECGVGIDGLLQIVERALPALPNNPHSTILNLKSIRDRQTAIDNAARV